MKMKNYKGKRVDAFLEVIKERHGISIIVSDIKEPTKQEVRELKARKCNHDKQPTQLIADEYGFMYDLRSCVLCGKYLGAV